MKLLIVILLCVCSVGVNAQLFSVAGIVSDEKNCPIPGCNVTLYHAQDTLNYYKRTITNEVGLFQFKDLQEGLYKIRVDYIGFDDYSDIIDLKTDTVLKTISLREARLMMNEVVVTANTVTLFADKKEYLLTKTDKEPYNSALSALDFLPRIQVLDQNISTADGKSVNVLINGIPSNAEDLSIIPTANIIKFEYYTNPPVQYSNMGLGAVINVITKKNQLGGHLGINTQNAITTGFGNNTINYKQFFKNSQLGITYMLNYRNYNKRILNEEVLYSLKNKNNKILKRGEENPYAYEEQKVELSFNKISTNNYIFSTKLSTKTLNRRRSSVQNVYTYSENNIYTLGYSSDKDKYNRPSFDIYFNKSINNKHDFLINSVGTYYSSSYKYKYDEMCDNIQNFETFSYLKTNKYSVITDVIYNYSLERGYLCIGLRDLYNNSKQNVNYVSNKIETNETYSYAGITGELGEIINYNANMGICKNTYYDVNNEKCSYSYFRSQFNVGYYINDHSELTLDYEGDNQTPSIGELTYSPFYKNANYLYVGNPSLKPSSGHNFSLSYYSNIKKFTINVEGYYKFTKNAISTIYENKKDEIIETYNNIDYNKIYKVSIFLQSYPFSSNLLRLRLYSEVYHEDNKWNNETWDHTGYYVIPSILISYKKWSAQLYYQTKKETLSGQQVRISPSMAYLECSVKPINSLSVTAGIRYPFYDSWEMTSRSYGTDLISHKETERIIDNANMIYINLVYNLSFGTKKENIKLKVSNEDMDSGILNRIH